MTMDSRILAAIRKIPRGKVSTYGAIARAAGYPGAPRRVAWVLHRSVDLPWQRVLGAGGEIKLRGDSAFEQRLRLEAEGVTFRGRRVDMKQHEFKFAWTENSTKQRRQKPLADIGQQTTNDQRLTTSLELLVDFHLITSAQTDWFH